MPSIGILVSCEKKNARHFISRYVASNVVLLMAAAKSGNKAQKRVEEIRIGEVKHKEEWKGSHTCGTGVPSKTGFSFSFPSHIHIRASTTTQPSSTTILGSNVCLQIHTYVYRTFV